jgi:hypothetical protein
MREEAEELALQMYLLLWPEIKEVSSSRGELLIRCTNTDHCLIAPFVSSCKPMNWVCSLSNLRDYHQFVYKTRPSSLTLSTAVNTCSLPRGSIHHA